VGSNPIARFKASGGVILRRYDHRATSPRGKARVCKTLIAGSNPAVASTFRELKTVN
jgi:hypothetical protein